MPPLPESGTPDRLPTGWSAPKPEILTRPTWWPAALAFGVTLSALGLITSAILLALGLAIAIVSLAGWIGDICHERNDP
jgi:hypothetical protein